MFYQLVQEYPIVSKQWRTSIDPNAATRDKRHNCHSCSANILTEGIGYDDLNNLIKNPQDLEFIIEIIQIKSPDEYEKEDWQHSDEEKYDLLPTLKTEGNDLYNLKQYEKAAAKYYQGLVFVDQLMTKEKRGELEWNKLVEIQIPLLLNYSQCKLKTKEYYEVIKHCTAVLDNDPKNVKALYRRGTAHFEVWNIREAKDDFEKVRQIDPSMQLTVEKCLNNISKATLQHDNKEQEKYKGKLF